MIASHPMSRRADKGMPSFAGQATEAQAKDLYGYLVVRAQKDW